MHKILGSVPSAAKINKPKDIRRKEVRIKEV